MCGSIPRRKKIPAISLLALFIVLSVTTGLSEEEQQVTVSASGEKCVLHEFEGAVTGKKLRFLAYIPPDMDMEKPLPALVFIPPSNRGVTAFLAAWRNGQEIGIHGQMLIIPMIENSLSRETAFAHFAKIMHAARERYSLDSDRISLWGYGAGARRAWHIARCLPDLFASFVRTDQPPAPDIDLLWFATLSEIEQAAVIKDDPRIYARNVEHIPHVPCPRTGGLLPSAESWKEVCTLLEDKSRPDPSSRRKYSFRTDRLRFNRSGWITIQSFNKTYLPAEFEVDLDPSENGISPLLRINTRNVSQLHFNLPQEVQSIEIDGQSLAINRGGSLTLSHDGRQWKVTEPTAVVITQKYPDRAGPLNDVLLTPLLFVVGTGGENEGMLREWAELTAEAWKENGKAAITVISDREIMDNDDMLKDFSLICFGDSNENVLVEKHSPGKIPVVQALDQMPAPATSLRLSPSPFALDRYIVVAAPLQSRAHEKPLRLDWQADWVIYDGESHEVINMGMYDQTWEPDPHPRDLWSVYRRK